METTVGRLLIETHLPKDVTFDGELDKKGAQNLFKQIAEKHPDKYPEITRQIINVGADIAYRYGSSFKWEELAPAYDLQKKYNDIYRKVDEILRDSSLSLEDKKKKIIDYTAQFDDQALKDVLDEVARRNGSLYLQYKSGSRGKPQEFRRLLLGDFLYVDHRDRVIPVPVLHSVAAGFNPASYWLASYGSRKGWIATNLGTAESGYLSKQLARAMHRLVVVDVDAPDKFQTIRGLPMSVDDPDNVGAYLAVDTLGVKKDTVITPELLAFFKSKGLDQILVRSVLVRKSPEGGIYSRDVGLLENGKQAAVGDQVGINASGVIGEPVMQMIIGAKHSGGTKRSAIDFKSVDRMLQVPSVFEGGITHSTVTGKVTKIEPGPAGGQFVFVENEPHFVPSRQNVTVKVGDSVEAGDALSDGIPNPSKLVYYKGIGEGRRLYLELLRDVYAKMGFKLARRNFEIAVAGLVDHVRLTQPYKNFLPGEVISYSWLESDWEPREGAYWVEPEKAVGKYLEAPILHYTIGSRVLPSFVETLKKFKIDKVLVHDQPPPFESVMIPAQRILNFDQDWLVRMLGGTEGVMKTIMRALYEGHKSNLAGTSFVPSLVVGKPFGTQWPYNINQRRHKEGQ